MKKSEKGAVLRWELSALRKKELELAQRAQERLKNQVKIQVNESSWIYVPKDKLQSKGKDFYINKYLEIIQVRNRFVNKTMER